MRSAAAFAAFDPMSPAPEPARPTILIVDDAPESIDVLSGVLSPDYRVKATIRSGDALALAKSTRPVLILLDVMMPELDGYEVCRRLKRDPETRAIPVIFITTLTEVTNEAKGLTLGAVDYITKPYVPELVRARVASQVSLHHQRLALEEQVLERTQELKETRLQVIRRLGRAAEYRDNETGMHVVRMSHYSRLIALASGESEEYAELVLHASPMHDIGKIGTPDSILLKPGRLTAEEWQTMKLHTLHGAEIIGEHGSVLLQAARQVALSHHERWDGTGYPHALAGEQIPRIARIVAVADVLDALLSERPYKSAWSVDDAVEYVLTQRDRHFEARLADALLEALPECLEIREKYAD